MKKKMKNKEFVMSDIEIETSIRHSKNNIVRSVVLLKRAVNALTFANQSVESTPSRVTTPEMSGMHIDIQEAKRSIADALRNLEKYL